MRARGETGETGETAATVAASEHVAASPADPLTLAHRSWTRLRSAGTRPVSAASVAVFRIAFQ
jgi:hypothetical protein